MSLFCNSGLSFNSLLTRLPPHESQIHNPFPQSSKYYDYRCAPLCPPQEFLSCTITMWQLKTKMWIFKCVCVFTFITCYGAHAEVRSQGLSCLPAVQTRFVGPQVSGDSPVSASCNLLWTLRLDAYATKSSFYAGSGDLKSAIRLVWHVRYIASTLPMQPSFRH